MTTTDQRRADRAAYHDYDRAAHRLKIHSEAFEAIAAHVALDETLGEYAEEARTLVIRGYLETAFKLLTLAAEAAEKRDSYLPFLGVA